MKRETIKNIGVSVKERLLNRSRERKEDFQFVLMRYALERFLFRLSTSEYRKSFILKGSLLFLVWDEDMYRPTRDADFLGKGDNSLPYLTKVFQKIACTPVSDDGMKYIPETVTAGRIKEDQEYEGVRITLKAQLHTAEIHLQFDIGFGDSISPRPIEHIFPTLLGFENPILAMYPKETVIAEKFEALVKLGMANSRMKDFYDIWILSQRFNFNGTELCQAIQNTFNRRKTAIPTDPPLAFTADFHRNENKVLQWKGFIRKNKFLMNDSMTLESTINKIQSFLGPIINSMRNNETLLLTWDMTKQQWK